jgi:type VI secretion system secreted protein VgrG
MAQLSPLLLLTSPFGNDTLPMQTGTLHAVGMTATEQISQPFTMRLTVVSTERVISPNELVYQPVCLTIHRQPYADRFFNGIVRQMEAVGEPQRDRWKYHLDVVPRLWFLTQTSDCRIFQQKTVVEILQTIFAEHQVAPVEFRIFGAKPVREYTTQYNETDLVFVHRLLQESGYFYFFEHTSAAHTMVITDSNHAFKPVENPTHWVIHAGNNMDIFNQWGEAQQTAYGAVQLQDYDPTKPRTPVLGQQTTTMPTAGAAERTVFGWTAMTTDNQIADDRARFRIEASEAAAAMRHGHGFNHEFGPGRRFTLGRDPFTEVEAIDHAIYHVEHAAQDDTWITGGSPPHYENHFACFLQTTQWREPLSISRPSMAGIFSAIVLGNDGEEIHADSIARVKVRLLFDHRKETVASMATWVRVMQPWSGNTWGWQHLPRVGIEVGVSFMNGDPDAPVVVGCFYHQEMQPVFPIPSQQTKSGFRSRSTLHGGTQDYNELSFDDRNGQELVFVHAQKDHTTEVEHDQNLSVTHDRSVKIGHDETVTIGDSYTLTANNSITLRVGGNSIVINESGITITSAARVSIFAGAEISISAGAAIAIDAGAAITINAGAAMAIDVGAAMNTLVGAAYNVQATGEISLTASLVACIPFPT